MLPLSDMSMYVLARDMVDGFSFVELARPKHGKSFDQKVGREEMAVKVLGPYLGEGTLLVVDHMCRVSLLRGINYHCSIQINCPYSAQGSYHYCFILIETKCWDHGKGTSPYSANSHGAGF